MKFWRTVVFFGIFGVTLLATYYLHILYFPVDVVFYSAIVDAVLAAVIAGIAVHLLPLFRTFTVLERNLMLLLALSTGYIFAISVPTVIDRSLSFYILEKLQQRGGALPYASMEDVFKNEYMKEHHLVDIRLTEQLASGTIVMTDGIVKLTPRGDFIATCSRFFRKNFLPKHRLLMGNYTDALVDPFRQEKSGDSMQDSSSKP